MLFQSLRKIVFYGAVLFALVTIFSLTIGQAVPIEFVSDKFAKEYYDIIMGGFPIAVLCSMAGTLKRGASLSYKISVIIVTIVAAVMSFFFMLSIMFQVGFGVWIDKGTVYVKKTNPAIKVKTQSYGQGVFGDGPDRTVRLEPFMKYWYIVTNIDIAVLDKTVWEPVNMEKKALNSPQSIVDCP